MYLLLTQLATLTLVEASPCPGLGGLCRRVLASLGYVLVISPIPPFRLGGGLRNGLTRH